MNSYVANELKNKLFYAYKALEQAQDIIKKLEEQNKQLLEVIKTNDLPKESEIRFVA